MVLAHVSYFGDAGHSKIFQSVTHSEVYPAVVLLCELCENQPPQKEL